MEQNMIAVCITNYNRPDVLMHGLFEQLRFLPPGAQIFIVDDGSVEKPTNDDWKYLVYDQPHKIIMYEHATNRGIAAAKNKCLELAYVSGAEHIFLFDSDTWPQAANWWRRYVESPEPHLMYQFKLPGNPATDMREIYRDDKHVAYSHTRGAMIYIERRVLEAVGGMDTSYGKAMYEHTDWTNRIHNAGLTTYRAMDVVGSEWLLYCLDQDAKVESSISKDIRRVQKLQNALLYRKSKTSKEFKEFRS